MTSSLPIVIVGAGVLGLCTAFELRRRGRLVVVVDPGRTNASLVAAGMIAPAMESAIEDVAPEHARLLRAGRDLWPDFAEAAGVTLMRRPAEWRGGDVETMESRLRALGFSVRREGDRVITDDDWQIEPPQAVAALRRALDASVVTGRVTKVEYRDGRWRVGLEDQVLEACALVLATGAEGAIPGLPEAARKIVEGVQPIRGQIGVARRPFTHGVVRGPGAYVAPMGGGSVIGATMEPGRRDTTPDVAAADRLTQAAWRVMERAPEPLDIDWRAGVRGATSDGLPLVGPAPGGEALFMALAPRRNGWLLGPLVGSAAADWVEGRTPSPEARALDPRRF